MSNNTATVTIPRGDAAILLYVMSGVPLHPDKVEQCSEVLRKLFAPLGFSEGNLISAIDRIIELNVAGPRY